MKIAILSFGPFIGLLCLSLILHFRRCRKELAAQSIFRAADDALRTWQMKHPGKKVQDFNEGVYLYQQREKALQEVHCLNPQFLCEAAHTAE